MIRRSTAIATAAILLSLIVHFFGLSFTWRGQSERSAEEAAPDSVALGNAFEDVAETLPTPVPPESAPIPDPPVETPPEPERADATTSEALVASPDPQNTASPDTGPAKPVQPDTIAPTEPEEGGAPESETVEPSGGDAGGTPDAETTPPIEPDTIAEAPEEIPDASAEPVEAVTAEPALTPPVAPAPQPDASQQLAALPVQVTPTVPVTPSTEPSAIPVVPLDGETVAPDIPETTIESTAEDRETVESEEESDGSDLAVVSSLRPQSPTRRPAVKSPGLSSGRLPPSPLIESPLTAYQRNGTGLTVLRNGGALSGGLGFHESRGSGNSDITNYAGQVLVRLNRAPAVRVSAKGVARVVFEINSDGTLAWVKVIESTGSREINRAATAQVRSAAPFPPPPPNASRRLAFVYRSN